MGVHLPSLSPPPSGLAAPHTGTSSEPGPSHLPSTQHCLTVINKNILDQVRDMTKQYVLHMNTMPTKDSLLSILQSVVPMEISSECKPASAFTSSPCLTRSWFQANNGTIKKLNETVSYIWLPFKDYATHTMQDTFHLQEVTAIQNSCSTVEWRYKEVSWLLKDFTFLSMGTQVTRCSIFFLLLITSFSTLWTWTI